MARRAIRASAAASLCLGVVLASPAAAGAQDPVDSDPPQVESTLELTDSSTWISPDENIWLSLADTATSSAELQLRLHGSIPDRAGLDAALAGDLGDVREHFGPFEINPRGPTRVRIDPQAALPEGVYPIVVELVSGSSVLGELTTFVISTEPDETMQGLVAMLDDPDLPVAHQPDGSIEIPALDEMIALEDDASALTLAITGDVASAVSTSPNAKQLAAAGIEVPTSTFVEIEGEAWLADDADEQLEVQLAEGRAAITQLTNEPPAPIWVAQPSDTPELISWLSDREIDGFVLRESNLEPIESINEPISMTGPLLIETPGPDAIGVVIDETLGSRLDEPDPFLGAQYLVADMAVMMLGGGSDEFGFAIEAPPADLVPYVLEAVDDSPILAAATFEAIVHEVPLMAGSADSALPLARNLAPSPAASIGELPTTILFARSAITSFREIVGEQTELIVGMETNVAVGSAADLSETEREAYFDAVYSTIEEQSSGIEGPSNQTITLTARTQTVPYTIENDLDYQANVLLDFQSDALEFPDGSTIEQTLERGSNELELRVHARSAGDAVLQITVRSPDGTLQLDSSRVRVRSSVFSGLGVIISIAALLVLSLWWAREIVRSKKRKVQGPAPTTKTNDTNESDNESAADEAALSPPEETVDAE